jgi:tetratricopeptide (TPR) repeat protein
MMMLDVPMLVGVRRVGDCVQRELLNNRIWRPAGLESETGNCMQKVQARASARNPTRTYNFLTVRGSEICRTAAVAGLVVLAPVLAGNAAANTQSQALRARGAAEIYNLDRDRALETFRQAIAADPQDSAAYRGLASALWLSITFRRGNLTIDDYLGSVSRTRSTAAPPPAETVAAFNDAIEHALMLAKARVAANPRDATAHYEVGAAIGLRASYMATVDNSIVSAFRAAKGAYEEHEKVLELDANRKDAGLIVGTYRYIVATLSLPLRWVAYVAGFGGDKEKGLRLVEGAADYSGDNQDDARFALLLLYNREKRYDDALALLAMLRERFPRNRLMWLESGSTSLRAGRAADAERYLSDGIARFAGDTRQRMFGEEALWWYKRGAARAALGRGPDAKADLDKALAIDARKWVQGRTHLELGKLSQKQGARPAAAEHFRAAARLCDSDNDQASADEARRLLKQVS